MLNFLRFLEEKQRFMCGDVLWCDEMIIRRSTSLSQALFVFVALFIHVWWSFSQCLVLRGDKVCRV